MGSPSSHAGRMAPAVLLSMLLLAAASQAETDSITKADPAVQEGPNVYGYIQFHVLNQPIDTNGDNQVDEGRFRIQRARLSVEGVINDHIDYEMDIDPRAPDIGGVLRDAFFDLMVTPTNTLRLGQQKTRFGYENQVSSSRLYFVNRSEFSDSMGRGLNLRDLGVSLLGKRQLGEGPRLEYAVSVVNGAGMNVQRDNNKDKNVFGRIGLRNRKGADRKWMFGISGARGDQFEEPDDPADPGFFIDFKRVGTDFLIQRSRFDINGEFAIGPQQEMGEEETVYAYYLNVIGKTSRPLGPVLRYDAFLDEFTRWTVGAYYGLPNDAFRVLLNYEFRWEEGDVIDNIADDRLYLWTQVRF